MTWEIVDEREKATGRTRPRRKRIMERVIQEPRLVSLECVVVAEALIRVVSGMLGIALQVGGVQDGVVRWSLMRVFVCLDALEGHLAGTWPSRRIGRMPSVVVAKTGHR